MLIEEVKLQIDNRLSQGESKADVMAWLSELQLDIPVAVDAEIYLQNHGNGLKPQSNEQKKPNYILIDAKGNVSLDFTKLTTDLLTEFHFMTLTDTEDCYIYQDGYYQENGIQFIKSECQKRVGIGKILTEHVLNEIIGHIKRSTYTERDKLNSEKDKINLENGLLNVKTRELKLHSPDFLGTIRIPVTYVADADRSILLRFFTQVLHQTDTLLIGELFGYCLIVDYSIQKAFLFVGGGENGKSTVLNVLKAFIGKRNISNVSWQALEMNRFAKSALEGKLANIFADLPGQSMNMTTSFKLLTGNDAIGAEKKFGSPYSFMNYARLIFSANKPPIVYDEDSYAFWRRWIVIEFPHTFSTNKDINILSKLTTKEALSGLLLIALDGLDRLRAKNEFSYNKTVDETTEYYLKASDPVYSFITDMCEIDAAATVSKDELYQVFSAYCEIKRLPLPKPNSFGRSLLNQAKVRVSSVKPMVDGKRVQSWQGLRISVKDVKDVNEFPISNIRCGENTDNTKKYGKNPDNPDNPDTKKLTLLTNLDDLGLTTEEDTDV